MMYRGARAARKMLRFVHVCIYIDAGEPVRSAHGIHKLTNGMIDSTPDQQKTEQW